MILQVSPQERKVQWHTCFTNPLESMRWDFEHISHEGRIRLCVFTGPLCWVAYLTAYAESKAYYCIGYCSIQDGAPWPAFCVRCPQFSQQLDVGPLWFAMLTIPGGDCDGWGTSETTWSDPGKIVRSISQKTPLNNYCRNCLPKYCSKKGDSFRSVKNRIMAHHGQPRGTGGCRSVKKAWNLLTTLWAKFIHISAQKTKANAKGRTAEANLPNVPPMMSKNWRVVKYTLEN